jgi:hypothetical protein
MLTSASQLHSYHDTTTTQFVIHGSLMNQFDPPMSLTAQPIQNPT